MIIIALACSMVLTSHDFFEHCMQSYHALAFNLPLLWFSYEVLLASIPANYRPINSNTACKADLSSERSHNVASISAVYSVNSCYDNNNKYCKCLSNMLRLIL